MRKKMCNFLVLFMLMFVMTGCVKFNANMTISKDKSMDFDIIYAVDTSYFDDEGINFDESELKELKDKGFVVNDYLDGKMKGVKLSRSVLNIDLVSSSEDAKFSLSSLTEPVENENMYLFKIKKGLIKNTYVAKFEFNSSDSSLNDSFDNGDTDETIDLNDVYEEDSTINDIDEEDVDLNTDEELDMDFDSSALMGAMDLSFNVNLPYAAISNNASDVSNEGRTLKWNLVSSGETEFIEFEFQLYNMMTIYIGIGIIILLIVVIVFFVVKKFGKKNNELSGNQNSLNVKDSNISMNSNYNINNNINNNEMMQNSMENNMGIQNNSFVDINSNNNINTFNNNVMDVNQQVVNSNYVNFSQQQVMQGNNILQNNNSNVMMQNNSSQMNEVNIMDVNQQVGNSNYVNFSQQQGVQGNNILQNNNSGVNNVPMNNDFNNNQFVQQHMSSINFINGENNNMDNYSNVNNNVMMQNNSNQINVIGMNSQVNNSSDIGLSPQQGMQVNSNLQNNNSGVNNVPMNNDLNNNQFVQQHMSGINFVNGQNNNNQ